MKKFISNIVLLVFCSCTSVLIREPNSILENNVQFTENTGRWVLKLYEDSTYSISVEPALFAARARGSGRWTLINKNKVYLLDSMISFGFNAKIKLIDSLPIDSIRFVISGDSGYDLSYIRTYGDCDSLILFEDIDTATLSNIDSFKLSYLTWTKRTPYLYTEILKTNNNKGTYIINVDKPNLREIYLLNDTLTVLRDRKNSIEGLKFDDGFTLYRVQDKKSR